MDKAWKQLGGARHKEAGSSADLAAAEEVAKRRTMALPSIFGPYPVANHALPKPTPANLRRFAETPVVRRAINIIKDRVASMDWQVRLKRDFTPDRVGYAARKQRALRRALEEPNNTDSFRTLLEQVLEDTLVGGFGAIEMEGTGDPERPFSLWPVDGGTIQINPKWDGSASSPRYAQATGLAGTTGLIPLKDDELIYLRLNPRTHTPFGLGSLEVAFETVNTLLSAHRFAGKLASNAVVQYALWIDETTPAQHERLIRWWQDEIEGTGRVPILSSVQKPEVLRFAQGTDADLRLNWQQFLIRMVANAFNLPPLLLGLENDVNRSTAGELVDEAFHSAITPLARLVAEHITRDLFAKKLGWREFEFVFNELDARDEMSEIQIQTALLAAGVLTVNEVRAMRGLAALPGGSVALPNAAELVEVGKAVLMQSTE
ncbi:phage portal protein [Silvibacterium dinghuense]|uniref:Phage portal protein n=2 Tax=Silvibacterium dinghuense TaxID=1560006 RepID=A0A4V1NW53_9BACT|nr:phage portal protein [Silvibacterium dinghuense]